ncbi:MAG: hypothetical protein ABEJ80_01315 [Halarchaeum sp.]
MTRPTAAERERRADAVDALFGRAVRVPLPDVAAERGHHENMWRIADECDRQADLFEDPDVPFVRAYEALLDGWRDGFEHRLERLTEEPFGTVANAYLAGERDDWVGTLAVYYVECLHRIEEHLAVDEQTFTLLVLRYPDSFTVNFSFATGALPRGGVRFESASHAPADLDEASQAAHYGDSQYSQFAAASQFREGASIIREQFPDPDAVPRDERAYGGYAYAMGRRGAEFAAAVRAVDPDPDRFDGPPSEPGLVDEGPEARRVRETLLPGCHVVA